MGSSPFARRYLGNRCFFLFLRVLRCFSSPGYLLHTYIFSMGYLRITIGEFPHSEICGLTAVCAYPQLIAACHVLRRLLVPRHPPYALIYLTYCLLILRITSSPIPSISFAYMKYAHFDLSHRSSSCVKFTAQTACCFHALLPCTPSNQLRKPDPDITHVTLSLPAAFSTDRLKLYMTTHKTSLSCDLTRSILILGSIEIVVYS